MAVDKLVDSTQLDTNLTAVADAIREKGGTSGSLAFPTGFVDAIDAIETGGGDANPIADENDVIFIDYDGTIRYSYTAQEFLGLTELPPNPTHDGLVAQGWNIGLADAKTWVQDLGMLVIGQLYVTESGDTEIDLCLTDPIKSGYLGLGINGTIQIDWGDGSEAETVTGTSLTSAVRTPHTWPESGTYTVKVKIVSGSVRLLHYGTYGCALFCGEDTSFSANCAYRNSIRAVRFGFGTIQLGTAAFGYCYSLRCITTPSQIRKATSWNNDYYMFCGCSLTGIVLPSAISVGDNYNFQYCNALRYASYFTTNNWNARHQGNNSLRRVNFGRKNTESGSSSFENCWALADISLPSSLTTFSNSVFNNCYALNRVTVPAAVITISTYAFQKCYSLNEIHFLPTTPPKLSNTNAFTGVPSTCVFYVPYSEDHSILEAYQNATNWSTYASQMQEEPQ